MVRNGTSADSSWTELASTTIFSTQVSSSAPAEVFAEFLAQVCSAFLIPVYIVHPAGIDAPVLVSAAYPFQVSISLATDLLYIAMVADLLFI